MNSISSCASSIITCDFLITSFSTSTILLLSVSKKLIKIENVVDVEKNKVRIKVFNTGQQIAEEHLNRIWNRFYKVDASRNRKDGGTGIGLAFVKAIMSNYGNSYGVVNKEDGVEFYFELELKI